MMWCVVCGWGSPGGCRGRRCCRTWRWCGRCATSTPSSSGENTHAHIHTLTTHTAVDDPSCPFLCSHFLDHISPISPPFFFRFLRVFTVSPGRFQRAPSRNPGPRNGGTRPKAQDLSPSFGAPVANQRTSWVPGVVVCVCVAFSTEGTTRSAALGTARQSRALPEPLGGRSG